MDLHLTDADVARAMIAAGLLLAGTTYLLNRRWRELYENGGENPCGSS